MNRISKRAVLTAGASALAMSTLAAPAANAAVVWEHTNYTGRTFGADTPVALGDMNDLASSMKVYGACVRVYEDVSFHGRSAVTCDDMNSLVAWNDGLHSYDNWNDRISSWKWA